MTIRRLGFTAALGLGLVLVGCGNDDPLGTAKVEDSVFCDAVFALVETPLNIEAAEEAAEHAPTEEQRRGFLWQAELGQKLENGETGSPDWEALGFTTEPTIDDVASVLDAAAQTCAGV